MRTRPHHIGFFDIDTLRDRATEFGQQAVGEGANQGLIAAQVALISSKTPKFTVNADYVYCKADPADASGMTCNAAAIWFPRIAQYAYPHVTPVKELNALLQQFNIPQRVTFPNDSALADLRRHVFFKAAESVAGNASSVSEPQAREIARLGFSKIESAQSVKVGNTRYTRGDVLGLPKQIPNDIEVDGLDAAGNARMLEKMAEIENAILAAPGVRDGLLTVDVAKHNVAQIGPKFVIPRLRVYLTPDRKSFVEYTAAANKVRVVTEGGEKLFSVEESILPADKLPASRGGVTASGSSTVPTLAEGDTAWYKTWWGITGIVLAGGGATYAVYRATKKNKQIPTL